MLVRTSGPLDETFHLLTLGHTCHYIFGSPQRFALFDPGLSAHSLMLAKRIENSGFPIKNLNWIFLTHLHADRIAGAAALRRLQPKLMILGTSAMQERLQDSDFVKTLYEADLSRSQTFSVSGTPQQISLEEFRELLRIDRIINDSENISISTGLEIRAISAPGHTPESLAFQILPKEYLIVDEGFGYFRGKDLSAPGGDFDQSKCIDSLKKISKIEVSALCFPDTGYITGQLIRKHLSSLPQNTEDLFLECEKAHQAGMSDEDIRSSVFESFYSSKDADPVLKYNLNASFEAIWRQVLARRDNSKYSSCQKH